MSIEDRHILTLKAQLEEALKERDDLKKLYDGAVIVTEQARMSEKRQEHIAVKFAVERDTYKELAIDYKSGLAFERARSAKLVRALEAIEQAEIWTAMRDEHRYSGIDAGYATEARKALAEYETASQTESGDEK